MKILVLNAGSSSLKCELFEDAHDDEPHSIWQAQADWKQLPGIASIEIRSGNADEERREEQVLTLAHTVERLLSGLIEGAHRVLGRLDEIAVTGHRVVHGGERFRSSVRITPEVQQGIADLAPFAPLHNPLALSAMEGAQQVLGRESIHVAVFDTSFHRTLPPEAYLYPGPRVWAEKGLRRYGFHGISHQYLSKRTAAILTPASGRSTPLRLITCHLGNGCSLCAIKDGISVDTTMGFTPLEGLMMGSRSGTVDPGLLLYLLKHEKQTPEKIDQVLNHESGLLGLSGVSSDMRQVTAAAESGDTNAAQTLDVFTYRLAYFTSALVPSIGGLDGLIFSGGIGENSSLVRSRTVDRLRYLGLRLDEERNNPSKNDRLISPTDANPAVAVIHTRENQEIARECLKLVEN